MLIRRDQDIVRRADISQIPVVEKLAVLVEDLNPPVASIDNIDAPLVVDRDAVHGIEVIWADLVSTELAWLAPGQQVVAMSVELDDARVLCSRLRRRTCRPAARRCRSGGRNALSNTLNQLRQQLANSYQEHEEHGYQNRHSDSEPYCVAEFFRYVHRVHRLCFIASPFFILLPTCRKSGTIPRPRQRSCGDTPRASCPVFVSLSM